MQKKILNSAILFYLSFIFSGCAVIGGIFKTGVGVGIFIVVAIIVVLLAIFGRSKK